jgi:hypothetical protein
LKCQEAKVKEQEEVWEQEEVKVRVWVEAWEEAEWVEG